MIRAAQRPEKNLPHQKEKVFASCGFFIYGGLLV